MRRIRTHSEDGLTYDRRSISTQTNLSQYIEPIPCTQYWSLQEWMEWMEWRDLLMSVAKLIGRSEANL